MLGQFRYYKPDIHLTFAGIVGAMVAISAGAGSVPGIAAVLIGAVAGIIVPLAILAIDIYCRIDDPSGNIAVHGVAAIWGLLAAPLLARGLSATDRAEGDRMLAAWRVERSPVTLREDQGLNAARRLVGLPEAPTGDSR